MHTGLIASITETPTSTPDPLHSATDPAHVAAIAADMQTKGWVGAPVVILSEVQALTGAHRLAAAIEAGYVPVPQVPVTDLCKAYDIDWDALRVEHDDDWYAAAAALRDLLPADVVNYLGYDVDGA